MFTDDELMQQLYNSIRTGHNTVNRSSKILIKLSKRHVPKKTISDQLNILISQDQFRIPMMRSVTTRFASRVLEGYEPRPRIVLVQ